tara:strand:+ start:495 stop:857 length:363 start_codon:yes stop_codon:yes gene_type:complete
MSEQSLQSAVIKYIQLQYPFVRYCASLGGIRTSIRQAIKAKATGYVKGFPDLQITEARGGYFGLFIEIKMEKRYATKEQKEWIKDLTDRGYKAVIAKGLTDTITVVDDYLKLKKTNVKKG